MPYIEIIEILAVFKFQNVCQFLDGLLATYGSTAKSPIRQIQAAGEQGTAASTDGMLA